MKMNKRDFLKVSGMALAGLSFKPAVQAVAQREPLIYTPGPQALTATRWAMVINHRKCKAGCEECKKACHLVHNVPTDFSNSRHEIKWIWPEPFANAFAIPEEEKDLVQEAARSKPAIVLCNHCDHPPCVRVCPTKATFKRADGIVMMDFHRCIGCRYCMAACPYGSRSFNYFDPRTKFVDIPNPEFPTRMKGVVEKCNFCVERLAEGKLPACVEACPEKAMTFGDLGDPNSEVSRLLRENFTIKRKPELGTRPMVYYLV